MNENEQNNELPSEKQKSEFNRETKEEITSSGSKTDPQESEKTENESNLDHLIKIFKLNMANDGSVPELPKSSLTEEDIAKYAKERPTLNPPKQGEDNPHKIKVKAVKKIIKKHAQFGATNSVETEQRQIGATPIEKLPEAIEKRLDQDLDKLAELNPNVKAELESNGEELKNIRNELSGLWSVDAPGAGISNKLGQLNYNPDDKFVEMGDGPMAQSDPVLSQEISNGTEVRFKFKKSEDESNTQFKTGELISVCPKCTQSICQCK